MGKYKFDQIAINSTAKKKPVEEKIEALKKVKDLENIEEIKQKTQDLSQVIQKIGSEMYKQNQENNPPTGEEGPQEGEYKEKKQ